MNIYNRELVTKLYYILIDLSQSKWALKYRDNCIDRVMVSMLSSNVVDHGLKPWSYQIKDNKIGICCFFAKHMPLEQRLIGSESG